MMTSSFSVKRKVAQTNKNYVSRLPLRCLGSVLMLTLMFALIPQQNLCGAQSSSEQHVDQNDQSNDKHILGIIPNNRTSPSLKNYRPLTSGRKFRLAADDAFDRGDFALAAAFAGEAQLTDSNPSFGQGAKGYAHYFATSFADLAIGDFMTEAIFPTMLHQDPRYFRRGTGSGWSRLRYAAAQIVLTHQDSGGTNFNLSEILGNSAAVAISNAYYPENRNAPDAIMKLGTQIAVDMAGNILKEFWPDIARKFSRKNQQTKHP